ncbi:MAG TPA: type II toxin-antitoxin system prevent-host-death family antitoxin [Pyrinomonadaceae bacterium]|jgi:prevent-host-death family protein|nr:type II toxin-antitoxin system prevent-host-death family antitoxin [Pyrinomonadaceae bacterium]
MTKTVDVEEAKNRLSELVSLALEGNEVIISEGDKPVARLVPFSHEEGRRVADLNKGEIWTSDDFDDPLPDEFWAGAE